MFKPRCVLPLIVVAIAVMAACSEQAVSPTEDGMVAPSGMVLSIADVGPSEIVFALDVSDTVSSDELQSMVDALGSCLSDPSLIPQSGTITVSTLVYGDSVALITIPTAVTSSSRKTPSCQH